MPILCGPGQVEMLPFLSRFAQLHIELFLLRPFVTVKQYTCNINIFQFQQPCHRISPANRTYILDQSSDGLGYVAATPRHRKDEVTPLHSLSALGFIEMNEL